MVMFPWLVLNALLQNDRATQLSFSAKYAVGFIDYGREVYSTTSVPNKENDSCCLLNHDRSLIASYSDGKGGCTE